MDETKEEVECDTSLSELAPYNQLQEASWPKCYKLCSTAQAMGVSDCNGNCPSKFPTIPKSPAPAKPELNTTLCDGDLIGGDSLY